MDSVGGKDDDDDDNNSYLLHITTFQPLSKALLGVLTYLHNTKIQWNRYT